jgi:hypothetical protein
MTDEVIKTPTGSKRTPQLRPGDYVFAAVINDKLTLLSRSRLKNSKGLRMVARPVRVVDWPEPCGSKDYRLYTSAGWADDIAPQAAIATYDIFADPDRPGLASLGGGS